MEKITLTLMTRELCHEFFKEYQNDESIYMDMSSFTEYKYNETNVNTYYDKQQINNRLVFMIMLESKPIGEIKLKNIDRINKECTLSIVLINDKYKGKGYGTLAEKLAIDYAFSVLKMRVVNADVVLKNKRSQHVLEKVGFQFIKSEGIFNYYQIKNNKL